MSGAFSSGLSARRKLDAALLRVVHATLLALPVAAAAAISGCGSSAHAGVEGALKPPARTAVAAQAAGGASPTPGTPAPLAAPPANGPSLPARPRIIVRPIPFGAQRKAEMVAYARRHYGLNTYRLVNPHVIVIHFSETPSFQSTYNTFAPDVPDTELHELPGVCAHFVIDKDGTIYQLVALGIMCRHTVGLNWTAIGIEHVAYSDAQVLNDKRQINSSLHLVRFLRCRFRIRIADVIGHNESLQSPYHHENVAALRTQTHNDFNHADMQIYRSRLRALGGCPSTPAPPGG
jgi:N-acetylmuramoyl-L-alanine amidase